MVEVNVYCGTYGKYNSGSIAGEWIDLTDYDKDSFYDYCKKLHSDETDPEFMFQDYEVPKLLEGMIYESWIDPKLWDIIEYLERKNIDLDDESNLVQLHNEYCANYNMDDYIYTSWLEVEVRIYEMTPLEAFNLGQSADIRAGLQDYYRFNGNSHLEGSDCASDWIDECLLLDFVKEQI